MCVSHFHFFQIHMNKGSLSGLGLQLKERKGNKSYSAFEMKIKYLFFHIHIFTIRFFHKPRNLCCNTLGFWYLNSQLLTSGYTTKHITTTKFLWKFKARQDNGNFFINITVFAFNLLNLKTTQKIWQLFLSVIISRILLF